MESKILYTNDNAEIQCVAVKSIETVREATTPARGGRRTSSTAPPRTPLSSSDEAVFLLPHECLYSYLYIGAADGTLLALRFQIFLRELAVPGGGLTYEHRVVLEAQSKSVITMSAPAPSSNNRGSETRSRHEDGGARASATTVISPAPVQSAATEAVKSSINAAVCGVRAINAPSNLPYLFLLVHGRFEVHEDDTLQLLDREYTAPLGLGDATVLCMCVGEEQSIVSRQRRPPAAPMRRGLATAPSTGGEPAAAVDPSLPVAYYALLRDDWTVVLVECTAVSSSRLAFLDWEGDAMQWSNEDVEGTQHASPLSPQSPHKGLAARQTRAADTLLPVRPNTSTMAWCGDVLITGSPDYYCLYDTLHGTVLSQLEVSSLLEGCPPYTTYIRRAAVDPSRAGFALATEAAAVCSYSGSSSSSGSSDSDSSACTSSHSSTVSDESSDTSVRESRLSSGTTNASCWTSALVFRLREGQLHVCACAGRTDLTAAVPLADVYGAVREAYSCPPFLLCQRGEGSNDVDSGGADSVASRVSSRICASQQHLSAKPAESRRSVKQCEIILFSCLDGQPWTSPAVEPVSFMSVNLRCVRAFPLGLLGVSQHMIEALLWKPFATQLEDQIETGHYARVLRFVSQCFRGAESTRRVVLRQVCQASAARAMARRRYRVAFYFYTVAELGVDGLLRLFPELRRLPSSTQGDVRGTDRNAVKSDRNYVTGDGRHVATGSPGAAKSNDTEATFVAQHSRQLSYPSHAPYRALYRILISKFFSLVATAATTASFPIEDPAAVDSAATARAGAEVGSAGETLVGRNSTLSTAVAFPEAASRSAMCSPPPVGAEGPRGPSQSNFPSNASAAALSASLERTRESAEFALFCLFAIDGAGARRLHTTRDELLQFMSSVRTLNPNDCAAVVAALGLPPSSLLRAMLLAATGDADDALTRCATDGDVTAAGATLAMYARMPGATSAKLERLYQLHLPWMLEVDPPTTVQLLTSSVGFAGERPGPAVLLPILLTVGGTVLLDYLSYLIRIEGSMEASVHQLYATHLVHVLQTLRGEWGLQDFASTELGAADGAGSETGLVGRLRRALLSFLQWSPFYDKERVLAILVEADLYEEQCVVLEALEDHIGVLSVLVYSMKDVQRAVQYCESHHTRDCARVHQWPLSANLLPPSAMTPTFSTPAFNPSRAAAEGGRGSSARQIGTPEGDPPFPTNTSRTPFVDGRAHHETVSPHTAAQGALGDAAGRHFSASPAPSARVCSVADDVVGVPVFPSYDCQRVVFREAAAMAHYAHTSTSSTHGVNGEAREGESSVAVAPSHVAVWHPMLRFNQYLHMLLHVLLVPPTGSEIALSEVVWLLGTHCPSMSPCLVLSSLPGDVPLSDIAPYLIRAFQRLELNHQLARMESAAAQSALSDAVRRHVTLQQRCVWMDDHRRCAVCGQLLGNGGLVVVFPNLKPLHFRCHKDGTLDPERAVPFLSNVT
ncbi:hypothetical protein ABB37_01733 [Leptomonas pyrrhocoris]|uniref:Vacuolar sorting protein 39/Transforming growth factor beta receptor-associated zinc finger domain-containing protein n=1 Tax=Leptomonas pyrrhocoris TaxID=157538 RepID=A0A0M9G9I9_LEPPY|nr:hypothetical protein ABB37_01733 [Leptomonas pyrrhocoris]KPA85426.1 hypothetical protein ABB37_01733 [Leptomonas pyrrhocoris]|eukprot:XP_015663865.1 hypothetical protein ABB37_01733 [Leptomonas pyrrhocoris]